jgi:hypothetical protein
MSKPDPKLAAKLKTLLAKVKQEKKDATKKLRSRLSSRVAR